MGEKRTPKIEKERNVVLDNQSHIVYIHLRDRDQWFVFIRETELGDSDKILNYVISGAVHGEKDLVIFDSAEDAQKKVLEMAERENISIRPYIFLLKDTFA